MKFLREEWQDRFLAFTAGGLFVLIACLILTGKQDQRQQTSTSFSNSVMQEITERNARNRIELEARMDTEEWVITEYHVDPGFVRCHLRPEGYTTCFVHITEGTSEEVRCRPRELGEHFIDGSRCSWVSEDGQSTPATPSVDHPPVTRQQLLTRASNR
jgi:hypothetical protein